MKFTTAAYLAMLATVASVQASCSLSDGNYYCSQTDKIIYSGLGYSGSYQNVVSMDESTGQCSQEAYSFSGNLSPLDEELSVHFRGPLNLKQFGVYYPASNSKREEAAEDCVKRHIHHKHKRATEIFEVTHTVIVDGQGNTIANGGASSVVAAAPVESSSVVQDKASTSDISTDSAPTATTGAQVSLSSTGSSASSPASSASSASSSSATGDWVRSSYYTPGSADNCVFLNYYGGSGSGVWSSTFGNSLSYANADASGGSSSAVALDDITIASDNEFLIMSGNECSGSECGFYREGIPAYHGFDGANKIFVFEFEMPSAGSGSGYNFDMPAIWMLNAKIPRTLQYGNANCSCWKTGCGELDLFEILSAGSDKLISHLHDGQGSGTDGTSSGGGGSQDYFARPTSDSLKAAVIFTDSAVHILEVSEDFDTTLSQETVDAWISKEGSSASIGY